MSTWINENLRMMGYGTVYNTAGKIYNQPNTQYNGVIPPATWTNQIKN